MQLSQPIIQEWIAPYSQLSQVYSNRMMQFASPQSTPIIPHPLHQQQPVSLQQQSQLELSTLIILECATPRSQLSQADSIRMMQFASPQSSPIIANSQQQQQQQQLSTSNQHVSPQNSQLPSLQLQNHFYPDRIF